MGLMTSKESDAKLFIGQDGYYYVSPGQKQPVRGPATKEVEDTPKENSPDKKDRRNQMLGKLSSNEELKMVLTENLVKLLRHPETLSIEDKKNEVWLFFRLIEELAWVDVDNAFDFYMEWVQQRPSLRTSSHAKKDPEILKENFVHGADYIKGNQKLRWEDRVMEKIHIYEEPVMKLPEILETA